MLAWLCLGQGADLHIAQLMPLSLSAVNPDWFYLVAHPGSPGQYPEEPQNDRVCMCVCILRKP